MGFDAFYLEIYGQAMMTKNNEFPEFSSGARIQLSLSEDLIVGSYLMSATGLGAAHVSHSL